MIVRPSQVTQLFPRRKYRLAWTVLAAVALSATEPAPALTEVIGKIRANLEAHGYSLGPYRFHVTLAEIPVGNIGLKELQARVGSVSVPTFSLTLTNADYRFYREFKRAIREWTMPVGPQVD